MSNPNQTVDPIREARRIIASFVSPPIPTRNLDWSACFDGYEPGDVFGTGATEQEAIDDLIERAAECPPSP